MTTPLRAMVSVFMSFATFFTSAQNAERKVTPPNIVFILTDDMGYFDLGCYGNPYNQTPAIDSLAVTGMRFTDAYVASPVCSPSRAAILTGKHPARLHLTNFLVGERKEADSPVLPAAWTKYLPGKEITMAEKLKAKGYNTGMVGKWHLGSADSLTASAQGFDYERSISRNGLDYYNYAIASNNKTVFEDHGKEYLTDKLTDYGVEFIGQQSSDKPFFLYLAYSAPHVLIVPRGDKLRKYLFAYNKHEGKFNPYYAAMMESIDDGVRKIMKALAAQGMADNTLVVFTSDNGGVGLDELGPIPTNMEPLRKWKGHVYEGGIRVPLIIRWPGHVTPGSVNHHYITGTDYLPTFMEILGEKKVASAPDAKSFLSILYEPGAPFDRGPVYWHYPHFSNQLGRPAGAVRLGDFKLVERYETGAVELYNLKDDLSEANELSGAMPDKTREMLTLLKRWQRHVNANMPVKNPDYPGNRH